MNSIRSKLDIINNTLISNLQNRDIPLQHQGLMFNFPIVNQIVTHI